MAQKQDPAGLKLRLAAAGRLQDVLDGENFQPFSAAEIPEGRDRALANRLVTTALRRHGQLDYVIGQLLERGLPKKSGSFEAVLRLSLSQLLYLPELGAHSALFLAVEALKKDKKAQHLTGLMNAVLRHAQGNAARYWELPEELLFPDWLKQNWRAAHGEVIVPFAEALLAGAPLDLTLKDEEGEWPELLGGVPLFADTVRLQTRDRPVEALPGYADGEWWVQDVAAAVPARLMRLPQGARVLDLCAAPGGKTAQLVKAGYEVTALDNDGQRLARVVDNLRRLRYSAELVEADAGEYRSERGFDGILLDAPCSATGTFRRHPEVVWHRSEKDIAGRVQLQRHLIQNAVNSLRPGGVFVYCVCSLEPQEGEEQASWIEESMEGLAPDPITPEEMGGFGHAVTSGGHLRVHPATPLPGPVEGSLDGFFVARYRRRS